MPVVVVARREKGQIGQWKRLDEVWGLVDDQPAMVQFIGGEIRALLKTTDRTEEEANDLLPTDAEDADPHSDDT
jgi:hypothetical protein